jgi:hypothetical protein
MGVLDRVIRLLIAAAVAILFFTDVITGPWAIVLLVVAGIFFLTSLVGFCPIYAIFGASTCSKKTND